MHISKKLSVVFLATFTILSGCATTDIFAPEKKKSDLALTYTKTESGDKVTAFCQITETYMVMPEEGGKVGTVDVVLNDGREVVLHGEFSSLNIAGSQANSYTSNNAEMKELFGPVLMALPHEPFTANLYFITDTDKLTPESAKEAQEIYENIASRQSAEVLISGHTDSVGSSASNVVLSNKRAKSVSRTLVKRGVSVKTIKISGHGEEKLVVETADDVEEQKNRRVEISVR